MIKLKNYDKNHVWRENQKRTLRWSFKFPALMTKLTLTGTNNLSPFGRVGAGRLKETGNLLDREGLI